METDQSVEVLQRIAERDAARRDRVADAAAERIEEQGQDATAVERQLDTMQAALDSQLRSCEASSDANALSEATSQLDILHEFLSANAWLLPPYSLRKAEDGTVLMQKRLEAARAAQRPKKKFGFSNRSKGISAASVQAAQPAASVPEPRAAQPSKPEEPQDRVLRGLRRQTLVKRDADLGGADLSVTDAEDCTILLLGGMSALRLRSINHCTIVAGPVGGATYLEDVHDSAIVLAAHQVRIHASHAAHLFLDVGSSPIIEQCTDMGFSPLHAAQRGLLGLPLGDGAAGSGAEHWAKVQDFNWLKSTPSPNWRALSDEERAAAPCPALDGL